MKLKYWLSNLKSKRRMKKEVRRAKKRMKECARKYPDWRDDEYNMLENKFIWGYSNQRDNPEPSFYTLNDIEIYYNRKTNHYYLNLEEYDFGGSLYGTVKTGRYLVDLLGHFEKYMIESKLATHLVLPHIKNFRVDLFEADSLELLFAQFSIFVNSYIDYQTT